MYMNQSKITILLLFMIIVISAQNTSISPYSGIGIGESKFDQNVVLSSMAGTSSTYVSELGSELNFQNPAANRNLVFTTFGVSFSSDLVNYRADNLNENRTNSYISELSLGFPLSPKMKMGIGFQPFSAVGYEVSRAYETLDPVKTINYNGDGGLSSLHSFVSYNVNKELSLGLRANYLFGTINKNQEVKVEDADLYSNYSTANKINGLQLTSGAVYTKKLKKENTYLNLGATYTFGTKLNAEIEDFQSTYYYASNQQINVDTIYYNNGKASGKLGSKATLGISLNKSLKYRLALEGQYSTASDFSFENQFYQLNNSYRIAAGGWIIPDINSYKSYFQRMTYRFGSYYEKGSISLNNEDINQIGITFGLGLPVGKKGRQDPSMLNLGFELGQRGTTKNSLIQENFANIKIGLNFNDIWFKKRKYN